VTPMRPEHAPLPPGAVLPPMAALGAPQGPLMSPTAAAGDEGACRGKRQTTKPNQTGEPSKARGKKPRQSPSRFASINTFVDITMRGLSGRAALAWVVLWRDTKPNGLARTGVTDLARRMGCSTATAKRALAELRTRKLIEVADRGRLGGGPSSYRLLEAAPRETDGHGLKSAPC